MKDKNLKKRQGFEGQQLIVIPKKIITNFLSKDLITQQIYITDIGYYPKAAFHFIDRPQGINQQILIYCVEGSGWIEVNNKKQDISPSQFITIPANIPHKYAANENDPWTIYWIHFKGTISGYIIELLNNNTINHKPHLSFNENRIKLFEDICTNLGRGYGNDNLRYVSMIFYHFLSSLLYEEKFNYLINKKENNILTLTIDLMQSRINSNLTLKECASSANLSVSHFTAVFHEKTGYAPVEYYNHLKIQKACYYLCFTSLNIKEIAFKLGKDDQYYFSRMFSKLMGISPTEYRKRNSCERLDLSNK